LAQTIDVQVEPPLDYALTYDLATAPDLGSGLARVLSRARAASGAARVEWWEGDEFVAADGLGSGPQRQLDVGELGAFVFHGGHFDFELSGAIQALSHFYDGCARTRRWPSRQASSCAATRHSSSTRRSLRTS